MENYDSLSEAINSLRKQGYTLDFNIKENILECNTGANKLSHSDFTVDKFFRFDTDEDPADQSIIYAISSPHSGIKGILVNGYGVYSDSVANEIINKLKVH